MLLLQVRLDSSAIVGVDATFVVENSCNCTANEVCEDYKCQPLDCFDLEWSPQVNETDVDCGGEICTRRCSLSRKCKKGVDCRSKVCSPLRHICLPSECGDGELNGNETAIDCGGPQCDACEAGMDCERDEDCRSRKCETKNRFICLSSNCEGKPCGEDPFCPRCPVGSSCEHDGQCETDHCENGICYQADCERESCEDDSQCTSKRCSELTHTCLAEYCFDGSGRCGGLCDPCDMGGECSSDEDCAKGLKCDIDHSMCSPSHCFDGRLQPESESDIDCGGECIAKCSYLELCKDDADCDLNGICDPDAKRCVAATCVNQKKDANETDIDCGNSAVSGCLPCQRVGSTCAAENDADRALNMVCDVSYSSVVPAYCMDGRISGDETGVDCGGPSCARRCPDRSGCHVDEDCISNDCYEGLCVPLSCHNKVLDKNETDIDCGGRFCRPCTLSAKCQVDSDCQSGMCSEFTNKCQPPECATHCGGPCDPCPDSTPCSADSDCRSGYCYGETIDAEVLSRSFDKIQDLVTGNFLFPEAARGVCLPFECRSHCGKGDCPGCTAGAKCTEDAECASGSCDSMNHTCHASTCFNSIKDGEETDIDCGGPFCPRCTRSSQSCLQDSDCLSGHCSPYRQKCVPTSCFNGLLDGQETDVDCGGPDCEACTMKGASCRRNEDCASTMVCSEGSCLPEHCFNGEKDDDEIDVDCGLLACHVACPDGSRCFVDKDCKSKHCFEGRCLSEHCLKECGQPGCANKCTKGEYCEEDVQCEAGATCIANRCVNEESCRIDWHGHGASDPSGCGGLKCARCGPHRLCGRDSDCDFGLICDNNRCEFETCFDGLLSTGEVCVDGAGICKRRCKVGETCRGDFDCVRDAVCGENGKCSSTDVEAVIAKQRLLEATEKKESEKVAKIAATVIETAASIQDELEALTVFTFPAFNVPALASVSAIDWVGMIDSAASGLATKVALETNRLQDESSLILATLPPLTTAGLCQSPCVLETLLQTTTDLHPHVFYAVESGLNRVIATHTTIDGIIMVDASNLTFDAGLDTFSLSSIGGGAQFMLGTGTSTFPNGLVVESGSTVTFKSGTLVRGSKLIVLGTLIAEAGSVIEFAESIIVGRFSVDGLVFMKGGNSIVHGMLDLLGGSHLTLNQTMELIGSLVARPGPRSEVSGSRLIVNNGLVFVPPSSRLALNVIESSFNAPSVPVLVMGIMDVKNSAMTRFLTGTAVFAGPLIVESGSTVVISTNTTVTSLTLEPNSTLIVNAPLLVLDLFTSSATSRLELNDDLVLLSGVWPVSIQSILDVRNVGRLVLADSTNSSSSSSDVDFLGPVAMSSSAPFFVVFEKPSLTLTFNSSFIATHPVVIGNRTTMIFNSVAWIANKMENSGAILLGLSGKLIVSHTYTGYGVVANAGYILVLGDALVSSRNFTGNGPITVGSTTEQELLGLSNSAFAFLPSIAGGCPTGSRHTLYMSIVSTTSLSLDLCLASNTKSALLEQIGLAGNGIILTRLGGGLIDASDPLPAASQFHPTPQQLATAIRCEECFNRRIVVSASEGGTLEISNGANFNTQGHVIVTLTGYLATSRRALSYFMGGMNAPGEIWLGPNTQTTFSGILESSGNCTVEPDANCTITRSTATFSGHLAHSGYMSIEYNSNVTCEGFFESEGDILTQSSTSLSFLPPMNTAAHDKANAHGHRHSSHLKPISLYSNPVFYFSKSSILNSHGFLYFGPSTKSKFEKGALLESNGDLILEETGWLIVETSYAFFEGHTEILGHLLVKGMHNKAKFAGMYTRISGSIHAEMHSLVDLAGKTTYVQYPGRITSKEKGRISFSGNQAMVTVNSGFLNGSIDMSGFNTQIVMRRNTSFLCSDTCDIKRVNLTLEAQTAMDVSGKMEMNCNFKSNVGTSITVTGPNGILHVLAGDFTVLGNITSVNGGQIILETPRILGRRDLMLDRTVVKSPLLSAESCSGESLLIHAGAALRLEISPRTDRELPLDGSEEVQNIIEEPPSASSIRTITCEGVMPIKVETGGTLIIAAKVDIVRGIITEPDSFLVLEEGAQLRIRGAGTTDNPVESSLAGSTMLKTQARLISSSMRFQIQGSFEIGVGARLTIESGELKMGDGSSVAAVLGRAMIDIQHRAMVSIDHGASIRMQTEAFFDVQGKLKNNGRIVVAGHGSKASFGGHYAGTGALTIGAFAKAAIRNSFSTSHPAIMDISGGLLVFVQGSESSIKANGFLLRNSSRVVVEERSRLYIQSETFEFAAKSKFIISGGNVTMEQSEGHLANIHSIDPSHLSNHLVEIGGLWISSHSSTLDIKSSIRIRRGGRMELEGKVTMRAGSLSDFLRLETGSSLKLISGSLHIHPDLFMDSSSELFALGALHLHSSRFVNNGGLVSVEGKLMLHNGHASFVSGELDVMQSGAVHFRSPRCTHIDSSSSSTGEEDGFQFGKHAQINSQGLLQVHECAIVICSSPFRSSGDIVLFEHGKLALLASASFDKALPSSIHVEGQLVIEKSANLKWSALGTGGSSARIVVFGSLQFAASEAAPVEIAFSINEELDSKSKASITVKDSGAISGSFHMRNGSLLINGGRAEPGDLETSGIFAIEDGDFELMDGGLLEIDVRLSSTGEVTHDTVDIKGGSAKLYGGATLAFAVLDVDKFDLPVVQCDFRKLYWTRDSLRLAAYSVDFAKTLQGLSYHAYESETEHVSTLRVRVESVQTKRDTSSTATIKSRDLLSSQPGRDPGGVNRVLLPETFQPKWQKILEKYLGGQVSVDPQNDKVALVTCAEPFECRAFCTVLEMTNQQLAKELGMEWVAEYPLGSCDKSEFWPAILLPCVADGLMGTAEKHEPCSFPFEFEGVSYSTCAKDDILGDWCITEKGHWGGCICGPFLSLSSKNISSSKTDAKCIANGMGLAPKGEPCAFPFFEDRSSISEPHNSCIGTGMGGFGMCRTRDGSIAGCDASCILDEIDGDALEKARRLDCLTNGRGQAPPGKTCRFPFDWGGRKRFKCVGSGWGSSEGFCLTANGQRGGCACSGDTIFAPVLELDKDDFPHFEIGPNVHVLSEDTVEVRARVVGKSVMDRQWFVFAVKSGANPPRMPASALKDAAGHSAKSLDDENVDSAMIKRLDWRITYDFYVFYPGMDDEEFHANAVLGVKLKVPAKPSDRLKVTPTYLDLKEGGPAGNVSIERLVSDIPTSSTSARGNEGSLIEVELRPSEENQIWVSERTFFLRNERTIQVKALKDRLHEGQSHSIVLHVLDLDASKKADVSINIADVDENAIVQNNSKQKQPESEAADLISEPQLLEFIFIDDEPSASGGTDSPDSLSAAGRRLVVSEHGHTREYFVRLRAPPAHAVVVELEPSHASDQVSFQPRMLVFSRQDWNKQKRVQVWSLSGGSGSIQHTLKSKDSRFVSRGALKANALRVEVMQPQQTVKKSTTSGPSSTSSMVKKKPVKSEEADDESALTTTTSASSSSANLAFMSTSLLGTVFPASAYLFPRTTIQFEVRSVMQDSATLRAAFQTIDGKVDPVALAGMFVEPQEFVLNISRPSIFLHVWAERDPGHSFACLLWISPKSKDTSTGDDDNLNGILDLKATVNYVSRPPAIVISKASVSMKNEAEYSISLSVRPEKTVTVALSTLLDSVCLDLEANWERPCAKSCRQCLRDAPQLAISPRIVKFAPSTVAVTIRVVGWAENKILESTAPRDESSPPIIVVHRVLSETGNEVPGYNKDTPTVFGPNDGVVVGVEVEDIPPRPAIDPKRRVVVTPVANKPGGFMCSLAFIPRTSVSFQSPPSCQPETFALSDIGQEQLVECEGDDGEVLHLTLASDDPGFDQLLVDFTLTSPPPRSATDGAVVRTAVGVTGALATLVAILVVYVYMGPRAAGWREARKKLQKRGKRPLEKRSTAAESVPGGGGARGASMPGGEVVDGSEGTQSGGAQTTKSRSDMASFDEFALEDVSFRTVSAAVPTEIANPLFVLPAQERFHVSDVVVVRYEGLFDDSVQHFKGRIVEEMPGPTYKVLFVDGDVDDAVDPDSMRKYQDVTSRSFARRMKFQQEEEPQQQARALGSTDTEIIMGEETKQFEDDEMGEDSLEELEEEYDVTLERAGPAESFGLKIGWTTNDRVVVTGFTPGTAAFSALNVQLGDEIVLLNGQPIPRTFEQVKQAIRNSGLVLHMRLRPFGAARTPSRQSTTQQRGGGSSALEPGSSLQWT